MVPVKIENLIISIRDIAMIYHNVHRIYIQCMGLFTQCTRKIAGTFYLSRTDTKITKDHIVSIYPYSPVLDLYSLARGSLAGNRYIRVVNYKFTFQINTPPDTAKTV